MRLSGYLAPHRTALVVVIVAGVLGKGAPGPYNLAGRGTIEMADVADALGWYAVPLPDLAIDARLHPIVRKTGSDDRVVPVCRDGCKR